jgi:hypothetical protein
MSNLRTIACMNDGVLPSVECVESPTYFIDPEDPAGVNQLISEETFLENYAFTAPERNNVLVTVVEI